MLSRRLFPLLVALAVSSGFVLAAPREPREPDFYTTPRVEAGGRVIELLRGDSLRRTVASAQPGDVIELRTGTYAAPGGLSFQRSGRADAWIVLRGAKGTRPTIDLAGGELHVGASYVALENLDVVNGTGNNIHVVPSNLHTPISNIVIRDVRSAEMGRGTGAALKVAGLWQNGRGAACERVYVEGCELAGSRDNALLDAVGVRRSVVRNTWLHDPVVLSMKSPGLFFKGGSSEILIEKNLVSGIRGNAAIMVGGDTGAKWFDALHASPKLEAQDQVIRNNLLADFDDAAFEIRGAKGARILGNTVVTQTRFSIFRLSWGGGGSGAKIGNDDIEIADNLVVAPNRPTFAQNDGNPDVRVRFGPQLWAGSFKRGGGGGIPALPREGDVVLSASESARVLANPSWEKLGGLKDALRRFALVKGSLALHAGVPEALLTRDVLDTERSKRSPSLGAFEGNRK